MVEYEISYSADEPHFVIVAMGAKVKTYTVFAVVPEHESYCIVRYSESERDCQRRIQQHILSSSAPENFVSSRGSIIGCVVDLEEDKHSWREWAFELM